MILAIDVDYRGDKGYIAGVAFNHFNDEVEENIYTSIHHNVMPYAPGRFYQRELPCILTLLQQHNLTPDIIIIDGFVWLDGDSQAGLGAHLYRAINENAAVIGVAKNSFNKMDDKFKVYRGESLKPLYVTSVGIDLDQAINAIKNMHGKYRSPDLLKKADSECRVIKS